jgi:hypothetical protein
MENVENQNVEARRSFLKKVAYVAPAVMALGALNAQANTAIASSTFTHVAYDNGETVTTSVTGDSGTNVVTTATYQQGTGPVTTYSGTAVQNPPSSGLYSWANSIFEGWFK